MVDSKVETISRLAQWKIENFGASTYKRSDPFKLGIWTWQLSVEKNRYLHIRLFPEPSRVSKEHPPIARFVLKITTTGNNRRPYISPIHERLLRNSDDFVWPVDSTFHGRFTIDVEFLDLKICPVNAIYMFKDINVLKHITGVGEAVDRVGIAVPYPKGGEASSIWQCDSTLQSLATQNALQCLDRMLSEPVHSDVTINTSDGTLNAHKAILSTSSPVFRSMFIHDLKEKESSTIDINDMSNDSCMALLRYLYGCINQSEFWKHRLALLGAANKYDIVHLKDSCEESLLEDINSENVLERLQEAWLYQLNKLKRGCFAYLFDFGKIYDLRDEVNNFFDQADRELMAEMFQEMLAVWKPI